MKLSVKEQRKMLKVWKDTGWNIPSFEDKSAAEIKTLYAQWEETISYSRRSLTQFQ